MKVYAVLTDYKSPYYPVKMTWWTTPGSGTRFTSAYETADQARRSLESRYYPLEMSIRDKTTPGRRPTA